MTKIFKGSCLCGSIQFEADQFQPRSGHCHCTMCRKFHGAAYSTYGEVKREHFRWTSGENLLKKFVAENETVRQFCNNCGSSLTFRSPGHDDAPIEISLACFDGPVPVQPDAHIYIANAANWALPLDDLPQYEGWRDSPRLK